jgi:hypothetical protein
MQAFYTNLFSAKPESRFQGFLRIAHASLKEILAVRSALAWDVWHEAK